MGIVLPPKGQQSADRNGWLDRTRAPSLGQRFSRVSAGHAAYAGVPLLEPIAPTETQDSGGLPFLESELFHDGGGGFLSCLQLHTEENE